MNASEMLPHSVFWYGTKLYLVYLAIILAAMQLVFVLLPYRWNWSASVPIGLYRVYYGQPDAGTLVSFCLPKDIAVYAKERGYIHFGFSCPGWTQELLKPVIAIAGDTIKIEPQGVTVRGHLVSHTEVYATDSEGRMHETWITSGEHVVPEGSVFFLSDYHPRSWDSRYFGFIPTRNIVTTMEPIWTW